MNPDSGELHREAGATDLEPERIGGPGQDQPPESDAFTAARRIAYAFTSLSELEFYLVQRLMRGETMSQLGKRQGMTRAAISARVTLRSGQYFSGATAQPVVIPVA